MLVDGQGIMCLALASFGEGRDRILLRDRQIPRIVTLPAPKPAQNRQPRSKKVRISKCIFYL
jgi:hypothetical protein